MLGNENMRRLYWAHEEVVMYWAKEVQCINLFVLMYIINALSNEEVLQGKD